jgi:hypothetical protein
VSQNHWKVLLIHGLRWWFASFQVICIYFHPESDKSVEADPVEADPVGSADSDSADADPVGEDEFAGSHSLILLMLTLDPVGEDDKISEADDADPIGEDESAEHDDSDTLFMIALLNLINLLILPLLSIFCIRLALFHAVIIYFIKIYILIV